MRRYRVSKSEMNVSRGRGWGARREREGGRMSNGGGAEWNTGQRGRTKKYGTGWGE